MDSSASSITIATLFIKSAVDFALDIALQLTPTEPAERTNCLDISFTVTH